MLGAITGVACANSNGLIIYVALSVYKYQLVVSSESGYYRCIKGFVEAYPFN